VTGTIDIFGMGFLLHEERLPVRYKLRYLDKIKELLFPIST